MMKLHLDYSDMKRIAFEAILLVCLGVSIGLMFNYELVKNAFEGKPVSVPTAVDESVELLPVPVSLADVRALADNVIIVDARITELYEEGHLPGAVSLPLDDVDTLLDIFSSLYAGRSLILYCSGYGCPDSYDLAKRLMAVGFHDVMVYEGGYPEWRDAGLPVEVGGR